MSSWPGSGGSTPVLPDPDHDTLVAALDAADLRAFTHDKAAEWLARCNCLDDTHAQRCEVGLVLTNCDTFAETVETEFERI